MSHRAIPATTSSASSRLRRLPRRALTLVATSLLLALAPAKTTGETTRLSVSSASVQCTNVANGAVVSASGKVAGFTSIATNLVTNDTNKVGDAFVRDIAAGDTTRASISSAGLQGNAASTLDALSSSGRFAVLQSTATNLVSSDTNGKSDVFVVDRQLGQTRRASVNSLGLQGDGDSTQASTSDKGSLVAFRSEATNLVADDSNAKADIFVYDLVKGLTSRVSLSSSGAQADDDSSEPRLSPDGRFVVFTSAATNLVDGDSNAVADVFLRDLKTGKTRRVSVDSAGAQANGASSAPAVSRGGHFVAFTSTATNLVPGDGNGQSDVFVFDAKSGAVTRASVDSAGAEGGDLSDAAALSANGRFVAFRSSATNLAVGDTNAAADIFFRDRKKGTTARLSLGPADVEANGASSAPAISANGRVIVFESSATNLVASDTNAKKDVFLRTVK